MTYTTPRPRTEAEIEVVCAALDDARRCSAHTSDLLHAAREHIARQNQALAEARKKAQQDEGDAALIIDRAHAENARLRAALAFYADTLSWKRYPCWSGEGYVNMHREPDSYSPSLVETQDRGARARAALENLDA